MVSPISASWEGMRELTENLANAHRVGDVASRTAEGIPMLYMCDDSSMHAYACIDQFVTCTPEKHGGVIASFRRSLVLVFV